MSKSKIQVKPFLTTMDDALRSAMYNRLVIACQEAGGDHAFLAEDGSMIWRYTGAAVAVINAPFEFARPSDSREMVFNNFVDWLALHSDESAAILRAVEHNEPKIDPAKAPPDMVDAAAKNG